MSTATASPLASPMESPRLWETGHLPLPHACGSSPVPRPSTARSSSYFTINPPTSSYAPKLSPHPRSPTTRKQDEGRPSSPNYFGLVIKSENEGFSTTLPPLSCGNRDAPSQIRSAAAASPQFIPADQNAEFELFRRQSERHVFKLPQMAAFSLNQPARSKPAIDRTPSASDASDLAHSPKTGSARTIATPGHAVAGTDGTAKRSPKRLLSSPTVAFTDRRESPASFEWRESRSDSDEEPRFATPDDRESSRSLPTTDAKPALKLGRSETMPPTPHGPTSDQDSMPDARKMVPTLVTPQHLVNLLEASGEEVLLLDLRVSSQHSRSRIQGALNLCCPTTLLKRPSFDVQKLEETLKDENQQARFGRWRHSKYIVVYDAQSASLQEANTCVFTLRKFVNEGYQGFTYVIGGGYADFAKKFPQFLCREAQPSDSRPVNRSSPTVIGRCPMPTTKSAVNPFFGNIRQNMDLLAGVGQMPVRLPDGLTPEIESHLPAWLRSAADHENHGKRVADKFLGIEKREQKRMQEALSGTARFAGATPGPRTASPRVEGNGYLQMPRETRVQLAGIEKGSKNRYNNIWPFEHTRVKLEGLRSGECDYVNANYIQTPISGKRYIATQCPIPATFNDYWNMVWQQDVRVIVMLTAETEGGQVKADKYWSSGTYANLKLTFLSEHRASIEPSKIRRHSRPSIPTSRSSTRLASTPGSATPKPAPATSTTAAAEPLSSPSSPSQPYVTVRRFTLQSLADPFEPLREITQLQYAHWPDFGAPAHPSHLLGVVEQCNAVVRSNAGRISPAMVKRMSDLGKHSAKVDATGSSAAPVHSDDSTEGSDSADDDSDLTSDDDKPQRPIIVHCSAGCGRTGTFCTVDSVIDSMKRQRARARRQQAAERRDKRRKSNDAIALKVAAGAVRRDPTPMDVDASREVNPMEHAMAAATKASLARGMVDPIESTVEDFRLQRLSMVQSLRQYVLCYESVLEWFVGEELEGRHSTA